MLHADLFPPLADRLVERILGCRAEQFAIGGAETADGGRIESDLADRGEREPVQRAGRALRSGVEAPDPFQRVAEQVESDRSVRPGREQVDDAAPDREFPRFAHRARALIAVADQEGGEAVEVEGLSRRGVEGGFAPDRARREALQGGRHGGQDDRRTLRRCILVREPRHGVHPLRDDVACRRDAVIGQAVPGRQPQHRQLRCEEGESFRETGEAGIVAGDMKDPRPRAAGGETRDDTGLQSLRHAGEQRAPRTGRGIDFVGKEGG